MEIIDISREIKNNMVVYPGDPITEIKKYISLPKDKVNLSLIKIGSHTGTHIDSEYHIKEEGKTTADIPLNNFYGECRVLDLTDKKEIKKEDLTNKEIKENEIILLKTENSEEHYKEFREDFPYLNESAAQYLADKKIKAVGVDSLSVSQFNVDNNVHKFLLNNMVVFEGLKLSHVQPGRYIFIGFPLKIKCDGSPIRAVLLKN